MAVKLLRYVQSYVDRHGKARHYFRRKGYPQVPLPPPGSPGFMAAYEAANTLPTAPAATAAPVRFLPGSLGWAIERFIASDQYRDHRADNTKRQDLIPGGSSAGSAVAVAAGIVPLALGTDTAGSGRVPAMFNNIVGLKPSLGLISTRGIVPACRTLDCVSVFALNVEDAWIALRAIAGYDANDPYSRDRALGVLKTVSMGVRLGVPLISQRLFFGDLRAAADYESALVLLARMGFSLAEVDIEPLSEAAQLLYDGPWLAERYLAARKVLEENSMSGMASRVLTTKQCGRH
jgi:Asp-tRNA(Asn)/Glu-tRNA(Gln) amidotransferase A subunit family amidase